jgi:uncharacterized spore protein YtfJ
MIAAAVAPCSTGSMNIQQVFESIAERVSTSASVKTVYGDPVTAGGRTVIPVAEIRYGFGFGGGRPKGDESAGGGGGGRVSARPRGALEITESGTRWIRLDNRRATGAAFATGFLLGAAVMALCGTRRVEIVKRTE